MMRDGHEPGWESFHAHFLVDAAMQARWQAMIQELRTEARETIRQAHPKPWKEDTATR